MRYLLIHKFGGTGYEIVSDNGLWHDYVVVAAGTLDAVLAAARLLS